MKLVCKEEWYKGVVDAPDDTDPEKAKTKQEDLAIIKLPIRASNNATLGLNETKTCSIIDNFSSANNEPKSLYI